jgi:hypothetical protein
LPNQRGFFRVSLGKVEALHKTFLGQGADGSRNTFLAKRVELFARLEDQLRGMARYGSGLRHNNSIKKMLNISTRSYEHQGEIKRYAAQMRSIAQTANTLKLGTQVGWLLDTVASALEIEEACSTGRESECRKAKFIEGGKLMFGLIGGTRGGTLGNNAGTAACIRFATVTRGVSLIGCGVIGGALGGWAGGEAGKGLGERMGTILYEAFEN